jgi:hypothetical protein
MKIMMISILLIQQTAGLQFLQIGKKKKKFKNKFLSSKNLKYIILYLIFQKSINYKLLLFF